MKWFNASELKESGRYVHGCTDFPDVIGIIDIQMMKTVEDGPELPFYVSNRKKVVKNPLPITEWSGEWKFIGPIPDME